MEEIKRFQCGSKEICTFKEHFVNQRCFAPYPVRQSCPHIRRKDGKTWKDGSVEEAVLCQ